MNNVNNLVEVGTDHVVNISDVRHIERYLDEILVFYKNIRDPVTIKVGNLAATHVAFDEIKQQIRQHERATP